MNDRQNFLIIPELDSTNSYLSKMIAENNSLPNLFSVIALNQTQGRGQRGNQWASAPEQNLTFSFVLRSGLLRPAEQYATSEYAALGLLKTVARYLPEEQKPLLSIKWPNDIYYGERKIAGILIEHSITGDLIDYTVVGIGLNLNQTSFPDNLPNPTSLALITGQQYELTEVHARLMRRFGFMLEEFMLGNYAEVHRGYMQRLYRRSGLHTYRDAGGVFRASIKNVLPTGQIVLEREDGSLSTYALKEVSFNAD